MEGIHQEEGGVKAARGRRSLRMQGRKGDEKEAKDRVEGEGGSRERGRRWKERAVRNEEG